MGFRVLIGIRGFWGYFKLGIGMLGIVSEFKSVECFRDILEVVLGVMDRVI